MVHVSPFSVPYVQAADKSTEHNILIAIDESRILGLFIFDFLEVVCVGGVVAEFATIVAIVPFIFFSLFSKIWAGLYKKFTYFLN